MPGFVSEQIDPAKTKRGAVFAFTHTPRPLPTVLIVQNDSLFSADSCGDSQKRWVPDDFRRDDEVGEGIRMRSPGQVEGAIAWRDPSFHSG